tara:strand:- start:118 stop:792 length:675 start_codon:yes stop_codon:yes gene_type:complete
MALEGDVLLVVTVFWAYVLVVMMEFVVVVYHIVPSCNILLVEQLLPAQDYVLVAWRNVEFSLVCFEFVLGLILTSFQPLVFVMAMGTNWLIVPPFNLLIILDFPTSRTAKICHYSKDRFILLIPPKIENITINILIGIIPITVHANCVARAHDSEPSGFTVASGQSMLSSTALNMNMPIIRPTAIPINPRIKLMSSIIIPHYAYFLSLFLSKSCTFALLVIVPV